MSNYIVYPCLTMMAIHFAMMARYKIPKGLSGILVEYEMHSTNVNFVRLERNHTGSFLTVHLPYQMPFQIAERWAMDEYPGWEIVNGSILNPEFNQIPW